MTQSVVLQRQLKELEERLKYVSDPPYVFQPGDRVRVGSFQDVIVEETLFDGKVYLIDYTSVDTNYGRPVKTEHQKKYVSWVQVRRFQEEPAESVIHNADLNPRFIYRSLTELFNKAYHFGVKMEPVSPIGYEWEKGDRERLIDSIFQNIDIGKFTMVQYDAKTWARSGFGFQILDGRQRLGTLLDFYEDRLQWRGRLFSDLSSRDQNHFLGYPVMFAEVKELSQEKLLRYYVQLNTFGKVMDRERLDQLRKLIGEAE